MQASQAQSIAHGLLTVLRLAKEFSNHRVFAEERSGLLPAIQHRESVPEQTSNTTIQTDSPPTGARVECQPLARCKPLSARRYVPFRTITVDESKSSRSVAPNPNSRLSRGKSLASDAGMAGTDLSDRLIHLLYPSSYAERQHGADEKRQERSRLPSQDVTKYRGRPATPDSCRSSREGQARLARAPAHAVAANRHRRRGRRYPENETHGRLAVHRPIHIRRVRRERLNEIASGPCALPATVTCRWIRCGIERMAG